MNDFSINLRCKIDCGSPAECAERLSTLGVNELKLVVNELELGVNELTQSISISISIGSVPKAAQPRSPHLPSLSTLVRQYLSTLVA